MRSPFPGSRLLTALAAGDKLADKARAILNELATCGEPDADRTEMMVNELEEAESTYRKTRRA